MEPRFILLACILALLGSQPALAEESRSASPAGAAPPSSSSAEELPEHLAADAGAPIVTSANLLRGERFWPYHVVLERPWTAPGVGSPIPAGTRGVVVRVISGERARLDFGRHGVHDMPIADTDLLARANAIRTGTAKKFLPLFVEAIGPRLVSSAGEEMRPVSIRDVYARAAFVAVFADPSAPEFPAIAASVMKTDRPDVLTIVFPQGRPADAVVHQRLRALGWGAAFVLQHLSEPYTRSLMGEDARLPAYAVFTPEGRLLSGSQWKSSSGDAIGQALVEAIGPASPVPGSGESVTNP